MTGQHLCEAACDGDTAKVSTLLSTQCVQSFINYQDADGSTPLLHAAGSGHATVAKQLIAAPCNVDLQDKEGHTPLYYAAGNGHAAFTKPLIAARCNVDLQEKKGRTPLHYATVVELENWLENTVRR
jgi:ankyrin repeat protein